MSRTYDITISEFDLDRLEADLSAAERSAAEQTRRANENHAWALRAERERDAERALADQLAEALMSTDSIIRKEVSLIGQWSSPDVCKEALAAWKEVRKEH